jgi:hypothetical protein
MMTGKMKTKTVVKAKLEMVNVLLLGLVDLVYAFE